jgi:peptidoglycan/LPS O-acetylase OafA/YrhL
LGKFNYLHGLRGVAAFIVVIGHYLLAFYPDFIQASFNPYQITDPILKIIIYSPFRFFWSAELSVYIFFVLSSYVLSYKFFKYKDRSIVISSAVRRYVRLTVPILFTVFLSWIIMVLHLYNNKEVGEFTGSIFLMSGWDFTPDFFTMIKQGLWDVYFNFDSKTSYNAVLWTMKIEFLGSFMIFFIMYFFGDWSKRYIVYGILVISLLGSNYVSFVYGLIISDLYHSKYYQKLINKRIAIILMVFGLIFCIYNRFAFASLTRTAMMMGSFFIILSLTKLRRIQSILEKRVFTFLGNISFSLYLIHPLVLGSFSCILYKYMFRLGLAHHINVFITTIGSIPLILVISYLMYKHVDNTAIELSRKFEKIILNNLQRVRWKTLL